MGVGSAVSGQWLAIGDEFGEHGCYCGLPQGEARNAAPWLMCRRWRGELGIGQECYGKSSTPTGTEDDSVLPLPSWPCELEPQHIAWPA